MQVLQHSNEENLTNVVISSNYQTVNNILSETITELNSVQNELHELQNKSALLEIKNKQLITKLKTVLSDINSKFHLKDGYTQCEEKEVRNMATNCNIVMDSDISKKPLDTVIEIPKINAVGDVKEPETIPSETIEIPKIDSHTIEPPENLEKVTQPAPVEETKADIQFTEPDSLQTYMKKDMLAYLARYKIDFLKFLQCNRNNIEQIAGGCPELIRSFSCSSDNEKPDNKRSKTSDKPKRCKTKSFSELKPGVIDTGDHCEDASLKSSLYDDIEFHEPPPDRVDSKIMDTAPPAIARADVAKIGGDKRISAIVGGVQSKMNLLKSRSDASKPKKAKLWKGEIVKLESRHDSHYGGGGDQHDQKERDKQQDMMKPLETVFTTRMKERLLNKKPDKPMEPLISSSATVCNPPHSLPVVKYDLSTPDDPPFQLDQKKEPPEVVKTAPTIAPVEERPPTAAASTTTTTTTAATTATKSSSGSKPHKPSKSSKSNHHHHQQQQPQQQQQQQPLHHSSLSREKSKHKHKHHVSRKKSKKSVKDLEDGEIV